MNMRLSRHRVLLVAVAGALALPALPLATADTVAAPCTEDMAGGDWARYGQDQLSQNRQQEETVIGPDTVHGLEQVWTIEGTGYQSAPPIVSGGCVFINDNGRIVAYDLDDGSMVWDADHTDTSGSFAVTVVDGRVHLGRRNGGKPRAAALDVSTGDLLWESEDIWFGYDGNQMASAVVHDGMQILFTTGPDFDPEARQGYAILDASTGETLVKRTTIPEEDLEDGYAGGGVWGTPAVDPVDDYLYVGTSNPESKTKEHAYDNAIIKLDLDPERETFGQIVDSYKGTPDSYTGYDNPVCQNLGGTAWINAFGYGSSPLCGQLDVDFGVGPSMWREDDGRLLGVAPQKSGYIHVFDAETMDEVWSRELFPTTSFLTGNLGRATIDDDGTIYIAATPGRIYAFDGDTGEELWHNQISPVPLIGGNTVLSNDVLYWTGSAVYALDPATGEVLWESLPHGGSGSITGGTAMAGGYLLANDGGDILAYQVGE